MRINQELNRQVAFAQFCINYNIPPMKLAELLALVRACARAWERSCCENNPKHAERENKTADQIQKLAAELGFTVSWSGLYPTLHQEDRNSIYLPLD